MRSVLLLLALGCGQKGEAPAASALEGPDVYQGPFTPKPAPAAEAVAQVNGEVIWDVEVEWYARERRLEPRAALEELIALELLAQEARRRGLGADPEVIATARRERVRRLIDQFAAASDQPAEIPAPDVDSAWNRPDVQRLLNHGQVHDAGWVRVKVEKKATPDEVEAARRLALELHARLAAARPNSYDEFKRVAGELHLSRTGKPVQTSEQPFAVDERVGADENFKRAAMALRTPGQISPVIRTRWGWDILFLTKLRPARVTTRAQADPEIRARMWADWRPVAFRRWLETFVAGARIARRDGALDRVEVDSTFGLP